MIVFKNTKNQLFIKMIHEKNKFLGGVVRFSVYQKYVKIFFLTIP